jgi:hypothetical protein
MIRQAFGEEIMPKPYTESQNLPRLKKGESVEKQIQRNAQDRTNSQVRILL